jgi:hypothetical protein
MRPELRPPKALQLRTGTTSVWGAVNQAHAKDPRPRRTRDRHLKTWKILAKLHCCPRRATAIVQAILVLQFASTSRRTNFATKIRASLP